MVTFVYPDNLFYQFFLPFLAIVTILFAVMTTLKIFDRKISIFLSIVIALIVLGGGNYPTITKFLGGGGFTVVLAFFAVFLILIALMIKKRG